MANEIVNSSLYYEVQAVLRDGAKPVNYSYNATLHPMAENTSYAVLKVISIDRVRDYEMNFCDVIVVEVLMTMGTYAKRIYPNRSHLELTLFKSPMKEGTDSVDPDSEVQSERYTAVVMEEGSPLDQNNGIGGASEDLLNITDIARVRLQLLDKAVEQLRTVMVYYNGRDTTTADVARLILTNDSKRIKVDDSRVIKGVDMVPPKNPVKREHVILPYPTRLVDVPAVLHKDCGGIYTAGLGYYLQDDLWYVYPCFDTTRANQSGRKVTIIDLPAKRFSSIERTYRQVGDNYVILATGETKFRSDGDNLQLNFGNGIRYADASNFMESFVETKGNKAVASRAAMNSEYLTEGRKNGVDFAPVAGQVITANSAYQLSQLARRTGAIMSFVWENANPDIIVPGTMVEVLQYIDGEVVSRNGVILKTHSYAAMQGQGMSTAKYDSSTVLSVFVQR